MLDRRPLALQLRDHLWDMVTRENLRSGDQLPSEQHLSDQFGVSRATVREALHILEDQGLVTCRHGVGRFIAPQQLGILSDGLTRLDSVTQMAEDLGFDLSTQVLDLREELPSDEIEARLNLAPGVSVYVVERVRRANQEPVIYSIDVFPRDVLQGEPYREQFAGSLLNLIEGEWGVRLAYSRAFVSAVTLDADRMEQLGLPDGAWILLEQTTYDFQDRPILYSKDYHCGDCFRFYVLRTRR